MCVPLIKHEPFRYVGRLRCAAHVAKGRVGSKPMHMWCAVVSVRGAFIPCTLFKHRGASQAHAVRLAG